jgi:hypothetical protein
LITNNTIDFIFLKSFGYNYFISLLNFKTFKENIHQNKPLSKSPNLSVFWVNIHNVIQIKLEQVQHFHLVCVN